MNNNCFAVVVPVVVVVVVVVLSIMTRHIGNNVGILKSANKAISID